MKRLGALFLGCSMLVSAAHAATFSEREMMDRLSAVEQKLIDAQQVSGGAVSGGSTANMQVQIDELREQMRAMNGKIEEAQHRAAKAESELQALSKDLDFRLQALEHAQPATGGVAGGPVVNMGGAVAAPAATTATPTPANTASAATPSEAPASAPAAVGPEFASAKEHYNYAFALMNKARYAEAGDAFASFVKKYPDDALVGNVYYWLGETWYVRGDFVKSADSFRQGFEAMPQGNKAPDNLLKLAMSLGQMKQQKQACVVLTQLLKKFPGPEIVRARATREQEKQGCPK
jgi:tol-pal system protein YbgF